MEAGILPRFSHKKQPTNGKMVNPAKNQATESEQGAFKDIIQKFGKLSKVRTIYVQRFRQEIQVSVVLSLEKYDGKLMNSFFDLEYDIKSKHPNLILEFFYPPGTENQDHLSPPYAERIYQN